MKEIPSYNNQEEKRKFFSLKIIDTDEQFFYFMSSLPKLFTGRQGIWRGLPERYFKLNSKTIYEIPSENKIFDNEQFWQFVESGEYLRNEILGSPIHRIDDSINDKISQYTKSNYNITAQGGLFIINADPYLPLEEAIIDRINSSIIKRNEDDPIDEWEKKNRENLICFDIHKRFIPMINKALNSKEINITNETMFPDFEKLKEEITFEKIIENIKENKIN